MEEIRAELLKNRPALSLSSQTTYLSLLKSVHKKVFPNEEVRLENFFQIEKFIDYLKDLPMVKRKTTLAALTVLTGDEEIREMMMRDLAEHNANELNQTQNEKQQKNMIEFKEVVKVLTKQMRNAKELMKQETLSPKDLQDIQQFILLSLTSGIYFEPRRSSDWNMKWKNYNPDTDNYYDTKKQLFVINNYKTSQVYGTHEIEVPRKLRTILKKWLQINPTDYILFNSQHNALTPSEIAHRLNSIFNKQISTSMLRHIYLTSYYAERKSLQDMSNTANAMGHSIPQALAYVKNPKEEE